MRSPVLIAGALASFLFVPAAVGAQANAPAVNAIPVGASPVLPYPAISATATATRDFVPDIARIAVNVDATAPSAGAALAAVRAKEQAARAAAAPAVIVVSGLSLQYDRGSVKTGGPIVTASETLATQVDVAHVAQAVEALRRFGALLEVNFDTTRHEQLYREALAEATSIAYGRAVAIAVAAKADVDRVMFVDAGAGAATLDAQNLVLSRIPGILALLGHADTTTIHATVIVTVRLR